MRYKGKKYRLKKEWKIRFSILLIVFIIILNVCIINIFFNKDYSTNNNDYSNKKILLSLYPKEDMKNKESDLNIQFNDDLSINNNSKEDYSKLIKKGIKLHTGSIKRNANINIVNKNKDEPFDQKNKLNIYKFKYKDYFLRYDIYINSNNEMSKVMITPYTNIKNNQNDKDILIPVSDLSLQTGSYEEQTKIYKEIKNLNNLTYIPITPYSNIQEVQNYNSLMLINKNSCLPNSYKPTVIQPTANLPHILNEVYYIQESIDKDVTSLFNDFKNNNLDIVFISGYRTYDNQKGLYNYYVNQNGQAAGDEFSARPGCSEHQSGLAFDLAIRGHDDDLEYLNTTPLRESIAKIAVNNGFIVRYPQNKTYLTQYQYESWHLRYVGKKVAKIIQSEDITLEQYLNNKEFYDFSYEK